MEVGDASGATRAMPRGGFAQFCAYAGVMLTLAIGPAVMVAGLFAGADWWIPTLAGAAITVFATPFAIANWRMVGRVQREATLLRDRGRYAVGEVVAVRPRALAEEDGVALTLRFTVDGVAPFEVEYVCPAARGYTVGDGIPAIVDQESGLFAIPSARQLRGMRGAEFPAAAAPSRGGEPSGA